MYSKTTAYMKESTDVKFETTAGVRQGGTESPYAYNCLAQHCLDEFEARCLLKNIQPFEIPFKIPKEASNTNEPLSATATINYLGYADDLVIKARTKLELQQKLEILQEVFSEFGLYMNLGKSETIIYNWKLGKPEKGEKYPESIVTLKTINKQGETVDFELKNSENLGLKENLQN